MGVSKSCCYFGKVVTPNICESGPVCSGCGLFLLCSAWWTVEATRGRANKLSRTISFGEIRRLTLCCFLIARLGAVTRNRQDDETWLTHVEGIE